MTSRQLESVTLYLAAWNETDALKRDSMLENCWSDQGHYLDPSADVRGRADLSRLIARRQAERPGARLEFASEVDRHHNVLRFLWRLIRPDGTFGDISIDFAETGADGRLVKVIGFFGPVPALGSAGIPVPG